jgi:hypothetical protein
MRLPGALADWLGRRRHPVSGIIALGVALASPALLTLPVADDLLQELLLRPRPGIAGLRPRVLDLFSFASGDPEQARALMNEGVFAWWTDPTVRLAFFRPLAGVTHFLDWHLFGGRPWLMHLQSLAWFAALLAAVGALYFRFASPRVALLALLLYAIDDSHAPAVGWIANRNALIALYFSSCALAAHDVWRTTGKGLWGWIASALFGVALLGGEMGVAAAAYVLAYALFIDRGAAKTRALTLVGYVVVVAAWRITYVKLGYGASGSGVYVDPASDPMGFVCVAIERVPVLLLATVALPWADWWEVYDLVSPIAAPVVWGLAVAVLVGIAVLIRPLLARSKIARFWACGMLFCVLPAACTFPHDRLLLGVTVGWMGLLAELLLAADLARPLLRRLAVSALTLVHLVLAPLLLPLRAANVDQLTRLLSRSTSDLSRDVPLAKTTLVLVNPPVNPFAAYLPLLWEARHEPRPRHFLSLASGVSGLRVMRVDSRTLSLRPERGFLCHSSELMLRSHARPLALGEMVRLDAATFEVTALTPDGRPAEVTVRFRTSLDDPTLLLMRWERTGYVRFDPPAPGETTILPAADFVRILSG